MGMFNVYVVDSAEVPHDEDADIEREALCDCATIRLVKLYNEMDFEPYAADADAIVLWHAVEIGPALLSRLTKTRIIVRNGVGFDNVDIAAAASRGIPVANVPDYGTEEVADHTITLTLALIRQLRVVMDDIRAGNFEWRTAVNCRRVRDQVFGVVGCGRIGTATAVRAKALGFRVRFYDPYLASGYEKAIGVERAAGLEDLLRDADVVSLHVPLDQSTRHLIDAPQLALMKKSAYLVNTARGPVVRYDALMRALESGQIAGAALDVLEHEPKGGDIMMRFPNVIVTPHSAFYSQESLAEMRRKSAMTVREALLNGRFMNVVNRPQA